MNINAKPARRIGVTMRVAWANCANESRDAIARDWADFLAYAMPEVLWAPIPNLGPGVLDHIRGWKLDGFILTGGNDLGEAPMRDETERTIIQFAIENKMPVFGVCRGLQVIQSCFNGKLEKCPAMEHVATRHHVTLAEDSMFRCSAENRMMVNSFHNFGLKEQGLSRELKAFALTDDGWVEGAIHKNLIAAVMWHPEREKPFSQWDKTAIRRIFGLT